MCTIVLGWQTHPEFALVIAANRDEFYARESLPMHWWDDQPLLGGRDLTAGGGWLTVSRSGRFAAVTNVRDFHRADPGTRSRGDLPVAFCTASQSPQEFLNNLPAPEFHAFNLLVADADELWWASNWPTQAVAVAPGVHGLSNAALDTPWPKVEAAKARFAEVLAAGADPEKLFDLMSDTAVARDDQLPDTGLDLDLERLVSAAFIVSDDYGTSAQTVFRMRHDGSWDIEERRFLHGKETGRAGFRSSTT